MMLGLDGITVLKQIKNNPSTHTIPFIMLTGDSSRSIVKSCFHADAEAYLIKPSNKKDILNKIDAVLKSASQKK